MATTLKLRRGTTAAHSTFTGAAGEVTVDTDKDVVVVHDGSTAGGFPAIRDGGALGTPSSGTVTNLTGTASININGTVGATTPAAGTFTDLTANNSAVISVNTSGNALRITQTGTGNALVVEDSTNPDSTPFVVDTAGRIISGIPSAQGSIFGGGYNPQIQVWGTGPATASQSFASFNTAGTGNGSRMWLTRSRGSFSSGVPTYGIVSNGDSLGNIEFAGDDGTVSGTFVTAAQILAQVDGTPGTGDMPGRLIFSTTADGASSPTERMRIGSDGLVALASTSGLSIGRTAVTSPAATDGNVFSGTYTPTLTHTTNITGSTPNTTYYTRVGNMVTVSGRVSIDPTATGSITLGVSLPIASDISNNCWGVCNNQLGDAIAVTSDNTNDRASFIGVVADAGNRVYSFTFQYQVV